MEDVGRHAPARIVGRYALYGELASGGMATVHLGRLLGPAGFSPTVAVKALHPPYAKDPDFVRMFLDEARLAGRIRHPNVVPVIDVHSSPGELLLILEYVHGESLARLVKAAREDGHRIPPDVASAIVCGVLHGLHAAHEAKGEQGAALGIVHRDVSPQNILVGADGVSRVLDFGVAKAAGRMHTTKDGQIKGKIAYMAPEQLRGQPVNRQADVYSAAVVLWETLTGERLFRGEDEGSTLERVLFGTVSPPTSIAANLPPGLDDVVMRGLARDRTARFSTAKEMAIALQAAVTPASPPVVGDWVEMHALDALAQRSRRIADLEAAASRSADAPQASQSGDAAPTSERPRPSAVPTVTEVPRRPDTPRTDPSSIAVSGQEPFAKRGRLPTVAAVLIACAAGGWLLFHERNVARSSVVSTPPVASVASTPVAATSAGPALATSTPAEPSAVNIAPSTAAPPRPATPPAARRVAPPPQPRTSAAPPSPEPLRSAARCSHRNADGIIEFDNNCLRESQAP